MFIKRADYEKAIRKAEKRGARKEAERQYVQKSIEDTRAEQWRNFDSIRMSQEVELTKFDKRLDNIDEMLERRFREIHNSIAEVSKRVGELDSRAKKKEVK